MVAEAEALVKQLGAKEAGQRDEAGKKLVDLARTQDIRDLLQKHADDADPEVRAVRRVLAAPDAAWAENSLSARLKTLAAKAAGPGKRTRGQGKGAGRPAPASRLRPARRWKRRG